MLHVDIIDESVADKIRQMAQDAGTSANSIGNIILTAALRELDINLMTKNINEAIRKGYPDLIKNNGDKTRRTSP
jgi:uncharacterized protein YfaT (DUF1175 family)